MTSEKNEEPVRVPGETADMSKRLEARLRDLVPEAFLDGVLDPERLLRSLGASSGAEPSFAFSWPGMDEARKAARVPTSATLVPDRDASLHWDESRDILVEGDNLQVLKLLRNGYSGRVKLIYVDPPYNTGDTFTYSDDFSVAERIYMRETGQEDEQGAALTSRRETRGRKHAPWLSMMFPRLAACRHLLRRDGVFLASIDNNEVHHLRLLLDSVFGAENFVDMMTWRGARKGDAKHTGGGQDYILAYARDLAHLKDKDIRWRERKDGLEPIYAKERELREQFGDDYDAMTEGLREWYRSLPEDSPSRAHDYYNRVDARGIWFPDNISSPNYRENLIYDWKGYSPPENGWRYDKTAMQALHDDGRLIYPEDMTRRVQIKSYLHMRETWAPASVFYKDRRAASRSLEDLMGARVFDDPKSTEVLARLIGGITSGDDVILDFFAGSGSTGQAVWEQNVRDGAARRWILVQRPETPDDSSESGRNALSRGFSTIFEITAERLRRAAVLPSVGGTDARRGFRVFRARETTLEIEDDLVVEAGSSARDQMELALRAAARSPVRQGADDEVVAWESLLKATDFGLDAVVAVRELSWGRAYEFSRRDAAERLIFCAGSPSARDCEELGIGADDALILRGDLVDDSTTLTLAPRLGSRLILLERMPREVSI